jgi:hypothetical protein
VGREDVDDGHEYTPILDACATTTLRPHCGRREDRVNNGPQIVWHQSESKFDHSDSPVVDWTPLGRVTGSVGEQTGPQRHYRGYQQHRHDHETGLHSPPEYDV